MALVILAVAGLLVLVLYALPSWFVGDVDQDFTYAEQLKAENDVRTTLLQSLAGLALLIGAFFTGRTYILNREGQVTERFTKAIDQLGNSDSLDMRLGGIYALERIANESERDHWPIVEVLTAFVRERAAWKTEQGTPDEDKAATKRPAPDVQAVMTVLGRRNRNHESANQRLDLRATDLRGASLGGAHLEGASLTLAHLERAALDRAHLEDAILDDAYLEGASLTLAHLKDASLDRAHLRGASLAWAHLEGASLAGADLEHAILGWAHLEDAILFWAQLEGALLAETHLEGAKLENAVGLTREQLANAITDAETKLPADLL